MKGINADRNRQVQALWNTGRTIDEISLLTGIPRSTVGYYVKKFKKYRQKGQSLRLNPPEEPPLMSPVDSLFVKALFMQRIIDILKEGDFQKLYYFLTGFKHLVEVMRYLKLTSDEQKLLKDALNGFFKGSKNVPTNSP
jgi:hypothetical protein